MDAGRHPLIEVISNAEVVACEGEPGAFRVRVRQYPRYVLEDRCVACGVCVDVCPVLCLTITHNGEEGDLRGRLRAPAENLDQAIYVSDELPQTKRVMVKDEDLCVHCGLCAERCPTAAWDMVQFDLLNPHAGQGAWPQTAVTA